MRKRTTTVVARRTQPFFTSSSSSSSSTSCYLNYSRTIRYHSLSSNYYNNNWKNAGLRNYNNNKKNDGELRKCNYSIDALGGNRNKEEQLREEAKRVKSMDEIRNFCDQGKFEAAVEAASSWSDKYTTETFVSTAAKCGLTNLDLYFRCLNRLTSKSRAFPQEFNFKPTLNTFGIILKLCQQNATPNKAVPLWNMMMEAGVTPQASEIESFASLADSLNSATLATEIFEYLSESPLDSVTPVTFVHLLSPLIRHNDLNAVQKCVSVMSKLPGALVSHIADGLFEVCRASKSIDIGSYLWRLCWKKEIILTPYVGTLAMAMFIACNDLSKAFSVLETLEQRGTVDSNLYLRILNEASSHQILKDLHQRVVESKKSGVTSEIYNTLVKKYWQFNDKNTITTIFREMIQNEFLPDLESLRILSKVISVEDITDSIKSTRKPYDEELLSLLLNLYVKTNDSAQIVKILQQITEDSARFEDNIQLAIIHSTFKKDLKVIKELNRFFTEDVKSKHPSLTPYFKQMNFEAGSDKQPTTLKSIFSEYPEVPLTLNSYEFLLRSIPLGAQGLREAEKIYDKYLEKSFKHSADIDALMASIYFCSGDSQNAMGILKESSSDQKGYEVTFLKFIKECAQINKMSVRKIWNELKSRKQNTTVGLENELIRVLLTDGQLQQAVDIVEDIIHSKHQVNDENWKHLFQHAPSTQETRHKLVKWYTQQLKEREMNDDQVKENLKRIGANEKKSSSDLFAEIV